MKKIKPRELIKIFLLVLLVGLLLFFTKDVYDSLFRAGKVNEELVKSYRPYLDVELIQKAARILKSNG